MGREESQDFSFFFLIGKKKKKKKSARPARDFRGTLDHPNSAQTLQTLQTTCGTVGPWSAFLIATGAAAPPTGARTARRRPGPERPRREGRAVGMFWGDNTRGVAVLLAQAATRKPSTCGHSPRVRSGLLPRKDRASNPVAAVRSKKGVLGRRRPFRAVRYFPQKWATRAPSTLQRG